MYIKRIISFLRLLSPTINGSLFSWSLTNVKGTGNPDALGFPFNQYFPFFVVSLFTLCSMVFVSFFPKSLDSQYQTSGISPDGETKTGKDEKQAIDDHEMFDKKITTFSMRYSRFR